MTDRPIIFSAPMIRALLDVRKTQTRRLIRPQPKLHPHHEPVRVEHRGERGWVWMVHTDRPAYQFATGDWRAPYAVGDRLWVRETWNVPDAYLKPENRGTALEIMNYAATPWAKPGRWRSSVHMPRWASRLTLVVTDVRVERLRDISEEDAIAEGVERLHHGFFPYGIETFMTTVVEGREVPAQCCRTARDSYAMLWNCINGPGAWDANPWVVALSFTVHRCNIGAHSSE